MKFAAVIQYTPDAATIAAARPSHREYLTRIKADDKLVMSGPFEGDTGAVIVYEAENAAEAEQLLKDDPFYKAGVFTSYIIHRWNVVFAHPKLVPELPRP
ncbi:MAG: YciI family protein [Bryobacteraceae bacterium]